MSLRVVLGGVCLLITIGLSGSLGCRSGEQASVVLAPDVPLQPQTERETKLENPRSRLREWVSDRAGEDGVFSMADVLKAKSQMEKVPPLRVAPSLETDAGIWNWDWLGPGNIGGRIRAIAIDPLDGNHILIGSASGGIWETINAGASWTPINDFLPTLAISSIVYSSTDPDILFAATGEGFGNIDALPGAGIFRSTDGGTTWEQLPNTATWEYVNRIAVGPTDTLLAATSEGIQRSTDGGDTWTNVNAGAAFEDLKYTTGNAVASAESGVILYSTDDGQTWNNATMVGSPASDELQFPYFPDADNNDDDLLNVFSTTGFVEGDFVVVDSEVTEIVAVVDHDTLMVADMGFSHAALAPVRSQVRGRAELAIAPSNPAIVYVSIDVGGGTIYRSNDGGQTFALISNPPQDYLTPQGWYDNAIWVAPDDPDTLLIGGISVWKSTNGGLSISEIASTGLFQFGLSAHADQHIFVAHPGYNGTTNRVVYVGNDGGIQRINDLDFITPATGWVNLANNLGITQLYGGAASPDGEYLMGGTQDNDTLHIRDGDGTEDWYGPQFSDGGYCAIDYDDPANPVLFKEAQYLGISRSTDGGNTYFPAVNGLGEASDRDNARFIAPFVMDPSDGDRLIAGGRTLWQTTDSGGQWMPYLSPVPGSPLCSAIRIAASDGDVVWAGYEGGQVWRRDGNWSRVDPNEIPAATISDIAINPMDEDEVFVVVSGYRADNVWYTSDGGSNWSLRTGSGLNSLPAVHISTLTFHPSNPDWIYVGTDLGVLASEDRGLTWSTTPVWQADPTDPNTPRNEGPANVAIAELFWQGDALIAATHGRGMFRTRPLEVVYVDKTNITPGCEDGTFACPYNTLREGLDAQGNGTMLSIEVNDYNEAMTEDPILLFKRGEIRATGNGAAVIR